MLGRVEMDCLIQVVEVGNNEQSLAFTVTVIGIDLVAVERIAVHIHQVIELTLRDSLLAVAQPEQFLVEAAQLSLLAGEPRSVALAAVVPASQGVDAPVVEDGGASVTTAKSLGIARWLAKFLAVINHERRPRDGSRHHQCRQCASGIAGKLTGCDALLVVILEEVEHVVANSLHRLPAASYSSCASVAGDYCPQSVVERHLVVEIVEMPIEDIVAINAHVVKLGNENQFWELLLDLRNHPVPELHRHHVRHVAAEAVHPHLRPVEQDVAHLVPRGRDGREMALTSGVVNAIVQLHRLIPVVNPGIRVETIVARCHGRFLVIELIALPQVD